MKILIIFLNISASLNNFWEHCSRVPPLFAPMLYGIDCPGLWQLSINLQTGYKHVTNMLHPTILALYPVDPRLN